VNCQQTPVVAKIVCGNYSPMTARISPMVCMPRIRFIFIDIVRFLLRSDSHWVRVCGQSADLWLQIRCLRELLADDRAHLADGLHTADQIFHSHNWLPPEWFRFFRSGIDPAQELAIRFQALFQFFSGHIVIHIRYSLS
jgi:hypothetical protein